MQTDIRYLDLLEQDLLRAADYESAQAAAPPRRRLIRPANWLAIAAGLVALLLIAGVVGSLEGSVQNALTSGKAVPAGGATGAGEDAGGGGAAGHAQPGSTHEPGLNPFVPNSDEQSPLAQGDLTLIIRKGDLTLTVPRDGLADSVDAATSIADEKGGFVFSSSIGQRAGSLVLRVPASRFDGAVTALRELGTVRDVTITSQDVTADFIDLNARLKIARGRSHVLQGLYDDATTIEQTIRVENALNDTQLRIEEIQGQLNVIENQTSQSTIRVDLREEGTTEAQTQDVENPSVGSAWDRAIAGFFGVISAVVIGLGYLLPIAILGLLVLLLVTLVRRRRAANPAP
jgi:hypothetical protein